MKTKLLRDSVKNALKEASGISVSHRFALQIVKPPFLVYSFMLVDHGESIDKYDLMVDISDYGKEDETNVYDIADSVANEMDGTEYLDEELSWVSYLKPPINGIESDDKNIQRVRMHFELHVVERN